MVNANNLLINRVFNIDTETDVDIQQVSIVFTTHQYSAKKDPIWRIVVEQTPLSKHSPYRITYTCGTCQAENTVGMTQIIRKLNGKGRHCSHCVNLDIEKRNIHSELMKNKCALGNNDTEQSIIKYLPTPRDLILSSIQEFERLSEKEQNTYFKTHLTMEDFQNIQPYIKGLRNNHISGESFSRLEFIPVFKVNNQMKFSSTFFDSSSGTFIKADQPIFICQECETEWRGKGLEIHKNKIKVLCPGCKLCRKTFKIRHIKNLFGQKVSYQSKQELKFVLWCADNNLEVLNGPNLPYMFANSQHEYRVDFYLPELNFLIEVKDNHIWHKNQIQSGKWKAKVDAVKTNLIENNGAYAKFIMIFPKKWMSVSKYILNCRCKI